MFRFFSKKSGDNSKDPVCGMRSAGKITMDYKGKTYAFCSDHCKERFEKNPEAYIAI